MDRQDKNHDKLEKQQLHITGVIEHGRRRSWAFVSGEELYHDSNMTIEVLQRVLQDIAAAGPLPRRCYIQMDNCSR